MPTSLSASFESQCPSCGKHFSNDSLVLRHMNNPRTSCESWSKFLESMRGLEQPNRSANRHPASNDQTNDSNNYETTGDREDTDDLSTATTARYEDTHPNASSVLGSGPGFMDRFDTDPHAEKRVGNIYYPFLSKEEWNLASWLLCSGLSMRAIDDFLALPIVSLYMCVTSAPLIGGQDPAALTLLHDCENTTRSHG